MLCECTKVPGAMSVAAKPIVTLYLRIGSPFLMRRVAILWPDGTWLVELAAVPLEDPFPEDVLHEDVGVPERDGRAPVERPEAVVIEPP